MIFAYENLIGAPLFSNSIYGKHVQKIPFHTMATFPKYMNIWEIPIL